MADEEKKETKAKEEAPEPTIADLEAEVAAAEALERRANQAEADAAAEEHEAGRLEGAHEAAEEARKNLADALDKQASEEEKAKK